jgi:hypothetical protein
VLHGRQTLEVFFPLIAQKKTEVMKPTAAFLVRRSYDRRTFVSPRNLQ